ncbi:MAG: putative bifunctional diguanylate cyclase/phosphodiesterase, partial [Janthinobacterium lividum]
MVPTLVVRTVLFAAGRRTSWDTSLDVPNRAGLLDLCADRLRGFAGAVEVCETVSVVHFDDLRELRLTLGADAAENVLAESAARLAQLPGAVVARTGLDALAVVRPVTTGTEGGSLETGRREGIALRSLLLDPVTLQGRGLGRGLRVRPETSVGVACVPDHGCDLEDLLAAADVALVTAATVPARVAVAEGAAILDVDALQLQTELPAAIADGQLRVYYQPLVASGTGRLLGSEALVRWQHPERGLLGPGAFIPLAERSQAIVALTYWVLGTAVAQCAQWRAAGYDLGVSVNVSANVLTEPSLIETVRRVIAEHRLEPSVLTVEVTESALLEDPVGAGAVLAALRAAGARVSLDDFGTGYTSLTMLRQLEVDELKIDRTFVEAASKAPADAAIVRALTDLAHRLSMEVVAEGIEDARTADLVMTLGVDVLQGFHYARPVPAEDLLTALRTPPSVPDTAPVVDSAPLEVEISAPRPADEAQRLALALRTRVRAQASLALLQKIVALAGEVCGTQF